MRLISLVGRPNVGKSSLFNVLTSSKDAIVGDIPGLTRDRHYGKVRLLSKEFLLIDTGGLQSSNQEDLYYKIEEQSHIAIDESDIIFFIVDARDGLTSDDRTICNILRKKNKKIILIINKIENLNFDNIKAEFSPLGIETPVLISTSHRINIDLIAESIKCDDTDDSVVNENFNNDHSIVISILGKPNVGKSTLINSIIGEDRCLAMNKPGTTRDSIDVDFKFNNRLIKIIDTAGIRKKGKVEDKIEKFSIIKSLLSIERSNLSILIIDGVEGLTNQDLQIFNYISDAGNPMVVAVNKWDLLNQYDKDKLKKSIDKKINILKNYQIFYISALKKIGLISLFEGGLKAFSSSKLKISTPLLNRFLSDITSVHQPPIIKGIRSKLKYMHQVDISPPTFIIHGNHFAGLKKDYIKYLESSLIKVFKIYGTPIRIKLNESDNPYEVKVNKVKKTGLVTRRREINKKRNLKKNRLL